MSPKQIAACIPAHYRKEILELQIIETAQPIAADGGMQYLAVLWKNYIAPTEDINCPRCYERVLKNFKELLPLLADLEKESKLLESI